MLSELRMLFIMHSVDEHAHENDALCPLQIGDDQKISFFTTSNTEAMYPIPALLARTTRKRHLKTLKTVLLSALSVKEFPWSTSALGEIFLFCARHNQVKHHHSAASLHILKEQFYFMKNIYFGIPL